MKRLLLTLWVGGAALYTANTFIFVHAVNRTDESHAVTVTSAHGPGSGEPLSPEATSSAKPIEPLPPALTQHENDTVPEIPVPNSTLPYPASGQFDQANASTPVPIELMETSRSAPVHSGPTVSTPIVQYVPMGTGVEILERRNGWARVREPGTVQEGWVYEQPYLSEHSRQLASTENPRQVAPADAEIDDVSLKSEGLNIASRPAVQQHRIGQYHSGRKRRFAGFRLFRRF